MKKIFNKKESGRWKGEDKGGFKGNRKFGDNGAWKRGRDRDERPTLHSAICDKCHAECEVPFRPTGSKPIYCRDCFRKEDGGAPTSRFSEKRFDRSDRFEKPAYRSTPHSGNEDVVKQLKALNEKMNQLVSLMNELVSGVEVEKDEEEAEETESEE